MAETAIQPLLEPEIAMTSVRSGLTPCCLLVLLSLAALPPVASALPVAEVQAISPAPSGRTLANFDSGWRFSRGDSPAGMMPGFDDSGWRQLDLPHDWSIEGPFGPEYASGNGYAPGGVGWYRKHFHLGAAAQGLAVTVEFDGIYDHSEVWLNGQLVGGRPYGYSSFECDLTPYLKFDTSENVLAVRVDHSRFADSRWYTGSGIYRHVRLRLTDKLRIAPWGVYITTPRVGTDTATVRVATTVENGSDSGKSFLLQTDIVGPDGQPTASLKANGELPAGTNQVVVQEFSVLRPQLWSPTSPRLYTLRSRLTTGSTTADETTTAFGIRTFRFDPDQGFSLNGRPTKLKGVCVHHEAGCLGAAVPQQVWERRLRQLKDIGVNAIRTSHNPPAPELLDLCDRLGFLVKDEAFDEFTPGKNKWVSGRNDGLPSRFGYAEDFEQWSVRDISDMVRRDRNHPSIILWSIGNEIDYANDPFSHPILGAEYRPENPPAQDLVKHAKPLIAAVKAADPSRPVTAALANVAMSDAVGLGELLDVVGYNYQEPRYPQDHAKFPRRVIFGSENSHQYSAWTAVRDNAYVSGQFLWTGIDYLGEAGRWPNRGSAAGLLDLCGFKKPLAWFRQSLWSDQPFVYLCVSSAGAGGRFGRFRALESWNWPSNTTAMVRCYTTCAEVELSLNSKSLGVKRRANAADGALVWEVPFEPGTLRGTGRQAGRRDCSFALQTAGPAHHIELLPDATQLATADRNVCHVEFRIVDAQGVRVPEASDSLSFELTGPARILGVENGDLNSPPDYSSASHKAFHGRGLLILQSGGAPGQITLRASAVGLEPASLTLENR